MSSLTVQNKDQIDIQTKTIDPKGAGVRKQSKVAVRGNPNLGDIVLGLKIKKGQTVTEFSFSGKDMRQYYRRTNGSGLHHRLRSVDGDG
jgi:hypothetical protein